MSHAMAWRGFFGARLLVAGPIYQAAIELRDEEFRRSDLEEAAASVEPPPRVSAWVWALIVVMIAACARTPPFACGTGALS
jgi:hypothetical protein